MGLVSQWSALEASLPPGWGELRVGLKLGNASDAGEVSALLSPLQPLTTDPQSFSIRLTRDGGGPSPEGLRRALERLDARGLRGALALQAVAEQQGTAAIPVPEGLAGSWRSLLAEVPSDWSDLLGVVELDSSDYLDRAAVHLAPLNPRRSGEMTGLRFRSAQHAGFGAAPGVVGACLARCDREQIRGRVRLLRVLCDSKPVGTQGPVWHIDGEMV